MATEFLGQPVYAPLNSSLDEIRLLRLLPGSDEDRLRCTLSIVSLDDRPHYEALSYVWGDDLEDTFPISLGGHTVQIRRNLHSALRGIRYLDCERILWIDALCIDQENVEERHSKLTSKLK
ncbi:heterokaryon incompatibility protein [Paraphaeosphaeria minitans]|uniref:Heterokaryon incompatibility protein n=1 Tax=Paraphaeosphaeria minitans TaxID=565426 RepID=A0A9P6KU41_9PLEO|nr:heterokaryon incompatibility protein [Paraphaeosphaeria minitans]